MKIGFTGTRSGMTEAQREKVAAVLQELATEQVHHGDCIGADADLHAIARALNIAVVLHPPADAKARAFCSDAAEERAPKAFLKRNRAIVDETDVLIATPYGPEQQRSGTWATIRYARKLERSRYVFMRDGSILEMSPLPP